MLLFMFALCVLLWFAGARWGDCEEDQQCSRDWHLQWTHHPWRVQHCGGEAWGLSYWARHLMEHHVVIYLGLSLLSYIRLSIICLDLEFLPRFITSLVYFSGCEWGRNSLVVASNLGLALLKGLEDLNWSSASYVWHVCGLWWSERDWKVFL